MSADFPKHWNLLTLEDAVEAIIDYRGKTPKKTTFGIPLITAKIVKNGRIETPTEFIAHEGYASWMVRGFPSVGDVVITTEAPLGEVAQITNAKVALAQRIVTLRGKKGILNNDYLLCVMQSKFVQDQLEARSSGSTVRGIKQSELRKVLLPIPPEIEQIQIANQVLALSKKIDLNTQTNQTLESIAQAIFKSWFVDFEPVKTKMAALAEGGTREKAELAAMGAISGKSETELAQLQQQNPEHYQQLAETAALFPSAMVESELGEIPEGWEVKNIENILELAYGKSLGKTERTDGNIPVYGSGGLTGWHNKHLVNGPGIIVGRKGTVGSIYWEKNNFFPIDTVFYVTPKNGIPLIYTYYLLQILGLENMNTDAAVPGLNRNNAYRLETIFSSIELINVFSKIASSLQNEFDLLLEQSNQLSLLRDSLLPKLLSGELNLE